MTSEGPTALDKLKSAIQDFETARCERDGDGPRLVSEAIVVYETGGFDDDGHPSREIRYAVPTDNFSMSGAIGLLVSGLHYVKRDVLTDDEP